MSLLEGSASTSVALLCIALGCAPATTQGGAGGPVPARSPAHSGQSTKDAAKKGRLSEPSEAPRHEPVVKLFGEMNEACTLREASACWWMGEAHAAGLGTPIDHNEAARYWAKACQLGHQLSCIPEIIHGAWPTPFPPFPVEGAREQRLTELCKAGDGLACVHLGIRYVYERGSSDDRVNRGKEILREQCAAGVFQACPRLIAALLPPNTPEERADIVRIASGGCKAGSSASCYMLEELRYRGFGVPQDKKRAMAALETLCSDDYGPACHALSKKWARGKGAELERALQYAQRGCALLSRFSCCLAAKLVSQQTPISAENSKLAERYRRRAKEVIPDGEGCAE